MQRKCKVFITTLLHFELLSKVFNLFFFFSASFDTIPLQISNEQFEAQQSKEPCEIMSICSNRQN